MTYIIEIEVKSGLIETEACYPVNLNDKLINRDILQLSI
jgi:hypothetical protein